jgi:hypothetical protein
MSVRQLRDDPALEAVAELLPERGAPAFVADAVGAGDPERAAVEYVRWRPGRSCTVLWAFPRDDAAPLRVSGRLAAGRLELEVFPLDDRLPGLPFAADAARVGAAIGIDLADAVVVAYKPTRRCVLRYTDASGRTRLFGKVFRDDRGAPMPAWFAALRGQLARWELPAPVGYLAEPRLLLFEAVRGATELSQLLRGGDATAAVEAVRRVAGGMAEFRAAAVEGLAVVTPDDILRPLVRGARELEPVGPDAARAVAARLEELARLATELEPEPRVLAHGAFRAGQLLVRDERVVVLDLDSLCAAGAAHDVGCFLAGLDLSATRSPRLRPIAARCETAFLDGIDGVDPRWIAWHRAAACVEHALRRVYALEPQWPEHMALLLARASEALAVPAAA